MRPEQAVFDLLWPVVILVLLVGAISTTWHVIEKRRVRDERKAEQVALRERIRRAKRGETD